MRDRRTDNKYICLADYESAHDVCCDQPERFFGRLEEASSEHGSHDESIPIQVFDLDQIAVEHGTA